MTNEQAPESAEYRRLARRCGCRCEYCGKDLLATYQDWWCMRTDHIIPKASGGPDIDDNKALTCVGCNDLKRAAIPWANSSEAPEDRTEKISQIANWLRERSATCNYTSSFGKYIDYMREFRMSSDSD